MKYRNLLSAFFLLLMTCSAQAEYRVFLLRISKKPPPQSSERSPASESPAPDQTTAAASEARFIESNLDPIQYRGYYPVAADEEVVYVDTWRCPGRTDQFKEFCPNPKGQKSQEPEPAS